jgi:threonine dehydrogenase-like Zn-dependent dehydrogenase
MAGAPDSAADLRSRPDIPEVMRAAVLFGPRDMRVVDRRVPRPGPDEVLVRVAMCGTCGTDLKIFDGHFPQTPPLGDYTPGHEWTGTVAATGSRVDVINARQADPVRAVLDLTGGPAPT